MGYQKEKKRGGCQNARFNSQVLAANARLLKELAGKLAGLRAVVATMGKGERTADPSLSPFHTVPTELKKTS